MNPEVHDAELTRLIERAWAFRRAGHTPGSSTLDVLCAAMRERTELIEALEEDVSTLLWAYTR